MLFKNKYERARKWQLEQNAKNHPEEYNGEKLYEPSIADELEKGDLFALMVSGVLTILPIVTMLLLLIVFIGYLFMRII